MANSTVAYGLRPLGKVDGNPAAGGQSPYRIADNASTSVYQGDLVGLGATGNVVPVTSSATTTILGVFNGCLIDVSPTTGKPTWKNFYVQTDVAQGLINAYVIDDPNQLYLVRSTNTALGNTALGTSYGIKHAAGSSVTGLSGVYMDLGATTTAQLRPTSVSPFIGNEEAVLNEEFVVKIRSTSSIL